MELLVAIAVGLMTAVGIYLILRRHTFPVILGLALLSYAVNLFIFASGRIVIGLPPIWRPQKVPRLGRRSSRQPLVVSRTLLR